MPKLHNIARTTSLPRLSHHVEHMLAAEKLAVDRDQIATSMATFARVGGWHRHGRRYEKQLRGKVGTGISDDQRGSAAG
jgi:hypothetical protein